MGDLPDAALSPLELAALLILVLYYAMPVLVAYRRRHRRFGWVTVSTLALGWIPIVWAVLLAWAWRGPTLPDPRLATAPEKAPIGVDAQPSGPANS